MKTEATMLKTFLAITVCLGALVAILATAVILTSCQTIEKDKTEIKKIANDLADEAIENAL